MAQAFEESIVTQQTPSIFLRSFFGFSPEEDGYIGWTQEKHREHILEKISSGDLFLIYGAGTADTPRAQQRQVLGILQVDVEKIRDSDKASAEAMQRKAARNWQGKWSYALPVRRAWRSAKPIPIDYVARETYRSDAGQAIAAWSLKLTPADVISVMKLQVIEVPVFGEPPLNDPVPKTEALIRSFQPSRGLVPTFGSTSTIKADGEHRLYVMRLQGDVASLLGRSGGSLYKQALVKVGFSNDINRRCGELNSGLPPGGTLKWACWLQSSALPNGLATKLLEDKLKSLLAVHVESLGKEFFVGSESEIESKFVSVLPR